VRCGLITTATALMITTATAIMIMIATTIACPAISKALTTNLHLRSEVLGQDLGTGHRSVFIDDTCSAMRGASPAGTHHAQH
jgi:hypothetical protein